MPQDRWDWKLYYDPDPAAPDRLFKIGGFIRGATFDPLKLRIPPGVAKQMDTIQRLAVASTLRGAQGLGRYDKKPGPERTAVIIGSSMGGPKKEATDLRVYSSAVRRGIGASRPSQAGLRLPRGHPRRSGERPQAGSPPSTRTTMPGGSPTSSPAAWPMSSISNGPKFTVDAACAELPGSAPGAQRPASGAIRHGGHRRGRPDETPPSYVRVLQDRRPLPDGSALRRGEPTAS